MKDKDWHDEMTGRQSEIVKDWQKKGWIITGMTEKGEVVVSNENVPGKAFTRTARIPNNPY
jgi:hypothetical protein